MGDGKHSPSHTDFEKEITLRNYYLKKERDSGCSETTIVPEHRFLRQ